MVHLPAQVPIVIFALYNHPVNAFGVIIGIFKSGLAFLIGKYIRLPVNGSVKAIYGCFGAAGYLIFWSVKNTHGAR